MSRRIATLLASTAIVVASPAFAQQADNPDPSTPQEMAAADDPGDIIVTATKRSERLQDVPISIQALGTEQLEQRQVANFDDYAKLLPSVSYQSFGPGQSQLYFRGVSSGGDGLHIGSRPATGLYLDETPLTTIANNVDLHIYDIDRVEALSGPQGTLYGASSLSGTLRIITNKPDTSKFSAGYDVEGNKFGKGDVGGVLEGFLNIPISERAAIRLVGFYQHDGGYIDNTPCSSSPSCVAQRTFPVNGGADTVDTSDNSRFVEKDFNDVDTYGGRVALKVDLDDNWTLTPTIIAQRQKSHGNFLYDPNNAGDLEVHDFIDEYNLDRWYQAALTIEGKVGDWDLTYAGGYFERKVDNRTDYSYYTVDYAVPIDYATYPTGDGGFLDPTQQQLLRDKYTKQTHELRFSSPASNRLRLTAGLFYQRQTDNVKADYTVVGAEGVPPEEAGGPPAIPGFGDDIFVTRVRRVDTDLAAFGEASFDILPNLTLLGGIRGFKTKTTAFGFSGLYGNATDPDTCTPTADFQPCVSVDKKQKETGETHKVSLSWKVTPEKMVYATYSTGFRPGGINRRAGILPYDADTLDNFEIGWKTTWFDRRLRINGAVFFEKWKKIQFGLSPIGSNGVTNTYNAGNAEIKGVEGDFSLNLGGFVLSGGGTYIDAKLTSDFCSFDEDGNSVCDPAEPPAAPRGTRLPVQPKFKGNLTARYNLLVGEYDSFIQGSVNHQGGTRTFLTDSEFAIVGPTSGFTTFDFSVGASIRNMSMQLYIQNAFDKRGQLSRNTACAPSYCGEDYRIYPIKPQLFGIKFGQHF